MTPRVRIISTRAGETERPPLGARPSGKKRLHLQAGGGRRSALMFLEVEKEQLLNSLDKLYVLGEEAETATLADTYSTPHHHPRRISGTSLELH
ncbi:hypothetical protein SRHO_G00236290 [Serrasalmus rhombeus]